MTLDKVKIILFSPLNIILEMKGGKLKQWFEFMVNKIVRALFGF